MDWPRCFVLPHSLPLGILMEYGLWGSRITSGLVPDPCFAGFWISVVSPICFGFRFPLGFNFPNPPPPLLLVASPCGGGENPCEKNSTCYMGVEGPVCDCGPGLGGFTCNESLRLLFLFPICFPSLQYFHFLLLLNSTDNEH